MWRARRAGQLGASEPSADGQGRTRSKARRPGRTTARSAPAFSPKAHETPLNPMTAHDDDDWKPTWAHYCLARSFVGSLSRPLWGQFSSTSVRSLEKRFQRALAFNWGKLVAQAETDPDVQGSDECDPADELEPATIPNKPCQICFRRGKRALSLILSTSQGHCPGPAAASGSARQRQEGGSGAFEVA